MPSLSLSKLLWFTSRSTWPLWFCLPSIWQYIKDTKIKNNELFCKFIYMCLWSHYLQPHTDCIVKYSGGLCLMKGVDMEARHLRGGRKWFKIIKKNIECASEYVLSSVFVTNVCKFVLTLETFNIFLISFETEIRLGKTLQISLSYRHPSSYLYIDLQRVLHPVNHKFISAGCVFAACMGST